MSKPLVSLLMAAYNTVGFVAAAIKSVQAQTHDNWELLIQDDGSTDGTYELACALAAADPRIKVETNGRNLGVNLTLKAVASRATGDFHAHFDSDDLLERYAIEETLREFERHPKVMLIYSDMAQIARDGDLHSYQIENYSASFNFDPNALYNCGWRHFGMYRAEVKKHIHGYNEKLSIVPGCGDGDFMMQIVEKFPAKRLPKVLYYYRNHGTNISRKIGKCEECPANPGCNYIRVWAKSAGRDQRTLQPLKKR